MFSARTVPVQNPRLAWRARRHWRGTHGAAPGVPPVAPVDRGGHRRGSGRRRSDGCPLRGVSDWPAERTAL
jgi:hypothetical protein